MKSSPSRQLESLRRPERTISRSTVVLIIVAVLVGVSASRLIGREKIGQWIGLPPDVTLALVVAALGLLVALAYARKPRR